MTRARVVLFASRFSSCSTQAGRTTLECGGCHGADGKKGGFLQDAKGRPVPIRDVTAPWTFRGRQHANAP
jgi:hypothetical protein